MKKRIVGIISLVVILSAYIVFRYYLFHLHGMKEFPLYLCVIGAILIVLTGLIKNDKIFPAITSFGYIVSFFAGILFEYDYGEGLNSMWIIWLICFVVTVIIGIIIQKKIGN